MNATTAAIVAPAPTDLPLRSAPEVVVDLNAISKRFPVRRTWAQLLRNPWKVEYATAIRSLSCSIARGECFGLLGPNGAGKTTLLKMLSTLVIPDCGTGSVGGHDLVRDADLVRRLVTPVIAEERSLIWSISARDNLYLYASLYGLAGTARRNRIEEVLSIVDLSDTGEKQVGRFSSGMKQRLLIARALLSRPLVLTLDEPTRSLDPVSAHSFRTFLREEITRRQGCTVVLATHNTEEAMEMCDRVAVLDRGTAVAIGTPEELSREVARARYRLQARFLTPAKLSVLEARGAIRNPSYHAGEADGWEVVEMEIPGGLEDVAEIATHLALGGVQIANLERVRPSLAEVIAEITRSRSKEAHE